MERSLMIEKFRNIGIKAEEKLVINKSLEKGKMGNLVVVIGANNSGKSNVLDALNEFGKKKLETRDLTSLSYKEEDRKPKLSLISKDGNDSYSFEIAYGVDKPVVKCEIFGQKEIDFMKDVGELKRTFAIMHKTIKLYIGYPYAREIHSDVDSIIGRLNNYKESDMDTIKPEIEAFMKKIKLLYVRNMGNWRSIISQIYEKVGTTDLLKYYDFLDVDESVKLEHTYKEKYKTKFVPTVINYTEKIISTSNLTTDAKGITRNSFFSALLYAIDVKVSEIAMAYEAYSGIPDIGILETLENRLNKEIKSLAKRFNKLYFLSDDTYSFRIRLESSRISFGIYRELQNQTLDYQSTGFRWFFDLYFNLLCSTTLEPGDVITMDEPATNLHPMGQIELRKFLKEFAIKNDITIVLATHSPFLIDMDYLDELRVVKLNENVLSIDNDFSTINTNDSDTIYPIKTALTVNNHILFDPDKKVVFVEGITDYNYMVAMKNMLKVTDIIFLPVSGLGNIRNTISFSEKQKNISIRLAEIKKHKPILMVDNDGAGKATKSNNVNTDLLVFTLADVSPDFKFIESLFDENDLKKQGLVNKKGEYVKHSSTSAIFKTFTSAENLSDKTKSNFSKLFDYLKNLSQ